YFYRHPRIPKSLLQQYREGILVGSACEAGEIYRTILDNPYNLDYDGIMSLVNFYDYMEIQPLGNNAFLLRNGMVESVEDLKYINRTIIELGKRANKLTVATCDVHFLNPEDEVYRRVLMAGQGFDDADEQAPLYFRTTEEMLKEFDYLGDALAREVVIENTNKIADSIEEGIVPVPPDKAPPEIPNSDEILRSSTYEKAQRLYGENLPAIVKDRIDVELNSIISNGYSVLYVIAQKLVRKSNSDGYVVGSRGSVGSSLVAYMSDITEVNSLCPHYICPNCKHHEFINDGSVGSGCDMEDKNCPECGTLMEKDGHDIPFETFLGFSGDKEPDIDLNFSGDYQGRAHKYIEELFGSTHVFRAGTIGTVAEKTAYGFVKKYFEGKGEYISNADIERLVKGCTGVKRTTGQHPGGIIVVPKSRDVHEFSPIQHPADDADSGIITPHFDYHSIDTNLLKLDILGHDDPTVIRMLRDLTGIDPVTVPMGDPDTMSLFTGTEALGVTPEQINSPVGTYAVPEFGTKFVRQMLVDTKPTTFSELVRISGLSHGTDVWLNNAQDLIRQGICTLKDAICTRDDIMVYLIHHHVENAKAFKIMESVRKGKGLTEEFEEIMREHDVPDWYIQSCKKIKYMFPKAHAVAYVTSAYRIAYFKVHYPKEFYCSYFTVRADEFDAEVMAGGEQLARDNLKLYEAKEAAKEISDKEKRMITILELVVEMYARGISFDKIDLYKSHATKFLPTDTGILPPLNALPGVGTNAAIAIAEARDVEKFDSIEDMQQRSKVNKTVIEVMRKSGVLDMLPESSQMDFFSMI
ncbi:MAG: PolC-type DNA polymerase III, partial [Clostridia bacterium]|nr:PolC-type DNA polymerase III [Clostridia bacterium]